MRKTSCDNTTIACEKRTERIWKTTHAVEGSDALKKNFVQQWVDLDDEAGPGGHLEIE